VPKEAAQRAVEALGSTSVEEGTDGVQNKARQQRYQALWRAPVSMARHVVGMKIWAGGSSGPDQGIGFPYFRWPQLSYDGQMEPS
jgi:hypothetical protein